MTTIRLWVTIFALATLLGTEWAEAQQQDKVPAAQARMAAQTLANWAIDAQNPEVLQSAIELALRSGASLAQDDPWSVAPLAQQLAEMQAASTTNVATLDSRARGVVAGISRLDVTLAPGERRAVPLTMAGGEAAIVEARLKRGSNGADLDLVVNGAAGVLGMDKGPETGTADIGTYVEFWVESCTEVEVVLVNAGSAPGNAVMLAPASSLIRCQ